MAYKKVGWKDYPSTDTPINATNLDHMDAGILENAAAIGDITLIAAVGDGTLASAINTTNRGLSDCLKSVSDGKKSVASAITAQGVSTAADAEFTTMASNITAAGNARYNAGYNNGYSAGYSAGGKIVTLATNPAPGSAVRDGTISLPGMTEYNYLILQLTDGRMFIMPNSEGYAISINNASYVTKTYTAHPNTSVMTFTSASNDRSAYHIWNAVYGVKLH